MLPPIMRSVISASVSPDNASNHFATTHSATKLTSMSVQWRSGSASGMIAAATPSASSSSKLWTATVSTGVDFAIRSETVETNPRTNIPPTRPIRTLRTPNHRRGSRNPELSWVGSSTSGSIGADSKSWLSSVALSSKNPLRCFQSGIAFLIAISTGIGGTLTTSGASGTSSGLLVNTNFAKASKQITPAVLDSSPKIVNSPAAAGASATSRPSIYGQTITAFSGMIRPASAKNSAVNSSHWPIPPNSPL